MDIYDFIYWTHTWEWWQWFPVWIAVIAVMAFIWKEG